MRTKLYEGQLFVEIPSELENVRETVPQFNVPNFQEVFLGQQSEDNLSLVFETNEIASDKDISFYVKEYIAYCGGLLIKTERHAPNLESCQFQGSPDASDEIMFLHMCLNRYEEANVDLLIIATCSRATAFALTSFRKIVDSITHNFKKIGA